MVNRLGWIAGLAGIALALARVERLLRGSVTGLPWEVILIGAALLGAGFSWAGWALRARNWLTIAAHLAAATLLAIRVAVPATTVWLFPTTDSFPALGAELALARDVIRSGVAPVIPLPGIVAILALVFWLMGAVLTWGLLAGRPYLAVLTPLVVYLEFAVMDKRPGGWWSAAFMLVIGFALVAVAADRRRDGTGRLAAGLPRRAVARTLAGAGVIALAVALAVGAMTSNALAGLVPPSGYLDWRGGSSLTGEYYGSITYNPFVGIRQQLISQTDVPVLVAAVEGELRPDEIYWRMVTLDSFNGEQWYVGGGAEIERPTELDSLEPAGAEFAGSVADVRVAVTILGLQQDWLPAPYAPVAFAAENEAVDRGYRVKSDDASLRFDALTYRGMTYVVDSRVPLPDLEVLARLPDGTASTVFAAAISAGEFPVAATGNPPPAERTLPDEERYLALPDELDTDVLALAVATTRGLQTDFERALALESFFLEAGGFRYSTAVLPGHSSDDLSAWLLDFDEEGYRTGYCEQFATAMAVMARLVGIPSRVVLGFSPGTVIEDGRVVVRDRNAHAWVELWMPTQGWMRFDPTPRGDTVATTAAVPFALEPYFDIPPPERPATETPERPPVIFDPEDEFDIVNDPTELPTVGSGRGLTLPGWLLPAWGGAVAALGLVPAVKWLRTRLRRRRLLRGDITAAWSEIVDRLADLGERLDPATTPLELANAIDPALDPLATVYGEELFAPKPDDPRARVAVAVRSLDTAREGLNFRYTAPRRLAAAYRLTSLLPGRRRRGG